MTDRLDKFLYVYKIHVIVVGLSLLGFFMVMYSILSAVHPEIQVAFVGKFAANETRLQKKLSTAMVNVKDPYIEIIGIGKGGFTEKDYIMKAKTLFINKAIDVYIFDAKQFSDSLQIGGFIKLNDFVKEYSIGENSIFKIKGAVGEPTYGIDISKSAFIKDCQITGSEFIIAIREGSKNTSNAIKLLRLILQEK